jgi:hypothetical protein
MATAPPDMDRSSQTSPGERCEEHNLAIGPSGKCVLCRREVAAPAAPAAPASWLSPVLVAAGIATALLAGVALGRRHTPPPPVAEVAAFQPVQPVEAPAEDNPVAFSAEPPPRERPAAPAPAPASASAPPRAPPQRNYLDEAYAAMPKGNDDAPARPAPAQPSATATAWPPPRPRMGMGMGGHGRHGGGRY